MLVTFGLLLIFGTIACAFKVMDLDIWWHLKAGEMMWSTRQIIAIDPFAYTREGLPYIARHEWLAQILFSLVHNTGGATGLILLRTVLAILAVSLPFLIRPSRTFVALPLAAWVILSNRSLLMIRPQLFTFVIMAALLVSCLFYLRSDDENAPQVRWGITTMQLWCLGLFLVLQFLWVNMHGAVSIFGLAIVGALLTYQWFSGRAWLPILGCLAGMVLVSLLSPNGFENITLLVDFLGQKPTEFIREWQPRSPASHIQDLGPLWLASAAVLLLRRRHVLFSALLLLGFGGLTFFGFRHGFLFCIAALAVIADQLSGWEQIDRWLEKRLSASMLTVMLLLCFGGLGIALHRGFNAELRRENVLGYGVSAAAKGAADFLEREKVSGNMFNSYNIGAYLLYRGYPDRKVFVDGRYVDYGLPFMEQTIKAGKDPALWKKITDEYDITYAVIDFRASPLQLPFPYISHLAADPAWKLVYIDDRAAVYVRDIPDNKDLIARKAYTLLTVDGFAYGSVLDTTATTDIPALEAELRRQIEKSTGVTGHILLAQLLLSQRRPAEAVEILKQASMRDPYRIQVQELLAEAYANSEEWMYAAQTLEHVLSLSQLERVPPRINRQAIAEFYTMAGVPWKAAPYTH